MLDIPSQTLSQKPGLLYLTLVFAFPVALRLIPILKVHCCVSLQPLSLQLFVTYLVPNPQSACSRQEFRDHNPPSSSFWSQYTFTLCHPSTSSTVISAKSAFVMGDQNNFPTISILTTHSILFLLLFQPRHQPLHISPPTHVHFKPLLHKPLSILDDIFSL